MPDNVLIATLILSSLTASATYARWTLEPSSEAKWLEDGWRGDFGEAHCYIGNTYVDQGNDALDIVNITFMQIANLSLAKFKYSFGFWRALDHIGVRQGELIFTVAMPGPLDFRGDEKIKYAVKVSVDGLEAAQIDTSDFIEDSEEQGWFVIREPQSRRLIERFSQEKPVNIDVVLNNASRLTFEYSFSPDLNFKVHRAQFEACLRVLAPAIAEQ